MKSRTRPRPCRYTLAISLWTRVPPSRPPVLVQSGHSSSFFSRQLPVLPPQDRKRRLPAPPPAGHCRNFCSRPPTPRHEVSRRPQAAFRRPCISILHRSSHVGRIIWRLAASLEDSAAPDVAGYGDKGQGG